MVKSVQVLCLLSIIIAIGNSAFAQVDSFVLTGSMNTPRASHTATLLQNGKVLIAGGDSFNNSSYLNSSELFDPSLGIFSYTGSMNTARAAHTATLLKNGKVLIVGGFDVYSQDHTLSYIFLH